MNSVSAPVPVLFVLVLSLIIKDSASAGERVVFADDKLSIVVPNGWKKSERNEGQTLGGWESPDQKASIFFQKMAASTNLGMSEVLDSVVTNFEKSEGMTFREVGEYKTGQVNGTEKKFPAIYTTLDATLKALPKDFEMKFYLFVVDVGTTQYFIQASSVKPVWDVRERQIMSIIKSMIARP